MNSDNLQVDSLDFDLIKSNLKEYLRGQTKFKDFDFEGSTMNILLDLLAYNTHYQAFYANMVANEAFLDSAVMRASAVSIGKHLGYVPKSIKASKNTIDIDLGTNSDLIEGVQNGLVFAFRGETLLGQKEGGSLPFVLLDNYKAEYIQETGNVIIKNVQVFQGSIKSFSFVVNSFDTAQKFILPSSLVDVDTMILTVQKSIKDTEGYTDSWFLCNDITKLNSDSNAYFIQETENGYFEIYFGDGIVGKALQNGNVITVEYLQTSGTNGNNCTSFSYSPSSINTPMTKAIPVCITQKDSSGKNVNSYGGLAAESISSIKYYAPRHYQTQERAITKDDYITILSKEFLDSAQSVYVWGGEENTPPEYGKVFVSIKPFGAKKLSTLEKLAIEKNVLSKKNMLTITPKLVDPSYIYLVIDLVVRYDPSKAKVSPSALDTILRSRINLFVTNNLQQFGKNFRLSTFGTYIDESNTMITSNSSVLKIQKRIEPALGKSYPYTIKFDNELYHPVEGYPSILSSSIFGYTNVIDAITTETVEAQLADDGYGNVYLYRLVRGEKVFMSNIGSIDYITGKVVLRNFSPVYVLPKSSTEISLSVLPKEDDIRTRRNDILMLDPSQVSIRFSQDETEIDNNQSGARFPY